MELKDKQVRLSGQDITNWGARLTDALEKEWDKIKAELQAQ